MNNRVILGVLTILAIVMAAVGFGFLVSAMVTSNENDFDDDNSMRVVQTQPDIGVELPLETLSGVWEGNLNEHTFKAVVSETDITVILAKAPTSMIYWKGTFGIADATGVVESQKLDSNRAVLSGASEKTFTYKDGALSFEFQAMGMTTTVEMQRAS